MPLTLSAEISDVRGLLEGKIDAILERFHKKCAAQRKDVGKGPLSTEDDDNLKAMILLLSTFNPHIEQNGFLDVMPKGFEEDQEKILSLLISPSQQGLTSKGFFRTATNEVASDLVREIILSKIADDYSPSLDEWNSLYGVYDDSGVLREGREKFAMGDTGVLQKHFIDMRQKSHERVGLSSQNASADVKKDFYGKWLKRSIPAAVVGVGVIGFTTGALVAGTMSGGPAGLLIAAAAVTVAIASVAAIGYIWNRYRKERMSKKTQVLQEEWKKEKTEGIKEKPEAKERLKVGAQEAAMGVSKAKKGDKLIPKASSDGVNADDLAEALWQVNKLAQDLQAGVPPVASLVPLIPEPPRE